MYKTTVVTLFLATLFSCSHPVANLPAMRSEDKLVYSALADSIYMRISLNPADSTAQMVIVLDSTVTPRIERLKFYHGGFWFDTTVVSGDNLKAHLEGRFPNIDWNAIWHDYDSVNSKRYLIDRAQVQFSRPHMVISWDSVRASRKHLLEWIRNRGKGPVPVWEKSNGLLCVSRVGYNLQKDQAIVFAIHFPIEHGEYFHFAIMERTPEGWRIQYWLQDITTGWLSTL